MIGFPWDQDDDGRQGGGLSLSVVFRFFKTR